MFVTQRRIPPRPAQLGELPAGESGTLATLRLMRQLVREGRKHPEIRAQALTLVDGLPSKAYRREAAMLYEFVRDQIRYTRDVHTVETLYQPQITLADRHGDCDDKVVLLASLLESIGHPTRFVAIGLQGGPFSHVYLETRIGAQWLAMDPTEPWPFGVTRYQGVTSRYVLDI
jgi:transglutaminase-like putative cysteine protease